MGVVNTGASSASLFTSLPLSGKDILFDDNSSDPAERDAYYSVNWARLFVRRLDTSLTRLDSFLTVNVNVNSTCNAFYDPSNVSLNLFMSGNGCSNTAEIADVVYHEFGHRVQHAVYSTVIGGDSDIVNTSLGEGFSDIYAAFMRDDPRIGVDFFGQSGALLRNCDNTNIWPDSLSLDPHFNGEIVSGAFWDLRKMIGLSEATNLYQRMMHHVPDAPEIFSDQGLLDAYLSTLMATIIADDNDNDLRNGTPHIPQILAAFAKHNVTLSGLIHLDVAQLPDQDTGSTPYPVTTTVSYEGPVGEIDTSSLILYYAVNGDPTYHPVSLTAKDSSFIALIPPQAAGSTVHYFATCKLNISKDSVISPFEPLSFLVGYRRIFFDPCELPNGWKLNVSTDQATTGLWELAKPYGTYADPTPPIFFIQQDTDHSAIGERCYVTGNKNGLPNNLTRVPGFDDVDNGATTLTSPIVHIDTASDPIVRYWYYYSNDQGDNPGTPQWVVKLSVDSGATWKTIIKTSTSTNGWTEQTVRVKDFSTPTSNISLQFVASDYIGAIVEAGIDDYEVLDVLSGKTHNVRVHTIPDDITLLPYPNPVAAGKVLTIPNKYGTIELYNMLGAKIAASNNETLLIPPATNGGIYILKITSDTGDIKTYQIVVEN
jgi:hypothetical protein